MMLHTPWWLLGDLSLYQVFLVHPNEAHFSLSLSDASPHPLLQPHPPSTALPPLLPEPPTTTTRPRPTSGVDGFQNNKHNTPYSLFHSFSLFFLCSGFAHTMAKASNEAELCFLTRRTTKTASTLLSWLTASSASLLPLWVQVVWVVAT